MVALNPRKILLLLFYRRVFLGFQTINAENRLEFYQHYQQNAITDTGQGF